MKAYDPKKTEAAVLEAFARDTAARRYHEPIENLSRYQKYEILTEYVQKALGEAWSSASHDAPQHFFLSFEYAFGKPTRFAEQALFLRDDLVRLSEIMEADYESLLQEEPVPQLGYGTPGRFGAGWMEASTECPYSYRGYGLRYRSGFIAQHIIRNRPVEAQVHERDRGLHPWEIPTERRYPVRFNGETVLAEGIDFPIPGMGGSPIHYVRLWDVVEQREIDTAEFKAGEYVKAYHKSFEPRRLVEFLYPSESNEPGKKLRLMQEYFFASATVQDILQERLADRGDEFQAFDMYLNELHPALAIPEMVRLLVEEYARPFEESVRFVSQVFRYGNQIMTDEAFESWPLTLVEETIPALLPILEQMGEYAKNYSRVYAGQEESARGVIRQDSVDMANLCAYFCSEFITFSESHKERLEQRMGFSSEESRRLITVRTPELAYVKALQRTSPQIYACLLSDTCTKDMLAEAKLKKKQEFARLLEDYQARKINPYSIYVVHIGNFHENNRQLMTLLYIADIHRRLLENPHLDIPATTFFFSGLAYPGYLMATEIVHLINAYGKWLNRDTLIENKLSIVFLEEINPEMDRELLSVADIFQTIRLPRHAALPMFIPEAILHGSAIFSSRHGISETILSSFQDSPSITCFEEGTNRQAAEQNLQFLTQHRQDLEFDATTIRSLLAQYNDSFSVLGSYDSYQAEMSRLIQQYMNEEQWNGDRAKNQKRMMEILQETGGLPCSGR